MSQLPLRCAVLISSVVAVVVLLESKAWAQPSPQVIATATALYQQALDEMKAKDYKEARQHLEEVVRLLPDRFSGRMQLAECYEHLDLLASAWSTYISAAMIADKSKRIPDRTYAEKKVEALKPRLARLVIMVPEQSRQLPDLDIERDDEHIGRAQWGVPIPVDKGEHKIVVTAKGKQRWTTFVEILADGTTRTVEVEGLADTPVPVVVGGQIAQEPPVLKPDLQTTPVPRWPRAIDFGFNIGPVVRLGALSSPDSTNVGLILGGAAFIAPIPRLSMGVAFEHADLGIDTNDASLVLTHVEVARHIDTAWMGARFLSLNTDFMRLSFLLAAGPTWQSISQRRIPAVSSSEPGLCSATDYPRVALRAGLNGQFFLGNEMYFATSIILDNARLLDSNFDDCGRRPAWPRPAREQTSRALQLQHQRRSRIIQRRSSQAIWRS